jgi:superfamily II DNA or RNA helicase
MPEFFNRAAADFSLTQAGGGGWRQPQFGALGALIAHWSLEESDATLLSIPTGTGKTAVAMAAPFLASEAPRRVLVLAPAKAIRRQLVENFSTFAQLQAIGALPAQDEPPSVFEMSGLADDWSYLEEHDVVVALPNSISPVHYEDTDKPPADLFDLVIVDEAHHARATTWSAILDHFSARHRLLLTATPRRRDGKPIPGSLAYYYPLRRALEEGFYKPVEPILLPVPTPEGRVASDAAIAARVIEMLASADHATSVLLIRAGSIKRLKELQQIYADMGLEISVLHNSMSAAAQSEVIEGLRSGQLRAVGVVGMLGEGFDLPSIRLVAYHDKHRSVPATVQLIGRLARVDPNFPQPSALITIADADVFPELKGVLRELYDEDSDWATVLPGILDTEIERDQLNREFVERLPASETEIDTTHLQPIKRALVYEVPHDWEPPFLADELPEELRVGAQLQGGTIAYAGADQDAQLLVVVVRFVDRPRWSSDPALANVAYELHVVAHRQPPEVDQPGLVLLNLASDGQRRDFESLLGLAEVGERVSPERLGAYIDSLDRIGVSSVGVRSTAAAARGRATYKNFMGGDVDRGMRAVDLTQGALGHVMMQVRTETGSANAGGAIEKSKIWLSRYEPLRQFNEWVTETCALLWYPRQVPQGRLLPGMDRGRRLDRWPEARPLAAELFPALFGDGFELWSGDTLIGPIEDLALYVNDDPTGTLADVEKAEDDQLRMIGVFENRAENHEECVWEGLLEVDGGVTPEKELTVRRGYGEFRPLSELLEMHPPTVYFLDGTTTIGAVKYSRSGPAVLDLDQVLQVHWSETDITAETVAKALERGHGQRSIHERLEEYLANEPKRGASRWILKNDGSGEIADYLVVEELDGGEIHLGLWHAKASSGHAPSVRIADCQEVTAQALRSRRWLTSSGLWSELAARVSGAASPAADLVEGSDSPERLEERLGLSESDAGAVPWTRGRPIVKGLIAVVQPGLSRGALSAQLSQSPIPPSAEAVRELFVMLADTATNDGSILKVLASA